MAAAAEPEALNQFDHELAFLVAEPPSLERVEVQHLLELIRLGPQRNLAGMGASKVESAFAHVTGAGAGEAHGRPTLRMLRSVLSRCSSCTARAASCCWHATASLRPGTRSGASKKALAIGRETGVLAWELRAAMRLICLWRSPRSQGEGSTADLAEAQQGLAEVYGRFSEEFGTLDLIGAKGLLYWTSLSDSCVSSTAPKTLPVG